MARSMLQKLHWKTVFFTLVAILGVMSMWRSVQLISELSCWHMKEYPTRTTESPQSPSDLFDGMPHVDACNRCHTCHVPIYRADSEDWFRKSGRSLMWPELPRELHPESIYDKSHYPNCTECWGCRQQLRRIRRSLTGFSLSGYETTNGQSDGHVYRIQDPNLGEKEFIVKLWCVDAESTSKKHSSNKCDVADMVTAIEVALAVQRIVDESQFRGVVSNVWLAPVNAVLPKTGYHVDWDGLWAEMAEGVPVDSLVEDSIDNGMDPAEFEDFMNHSINSTEVVMAAVLDLLTSQGDRHSQNVFVSESGHLTLIDSDEALGHSWRPVGVDSIFLPGTQYHTIQHIGHRYVRRKTDKPREHPLASVVLDYRCHAKNGVIGTDYPLGVQRVMERTMSLSSDVVRDLYKLPDVVTADILKQRAADMLTQGFEWTLENGRPLSTPSLKYPWHPPCCKIQVIPGTTDIECADPLYKRDTTRPPGDATYGEY